MTGPGNRGRPPRGFSLVELLVVIGIVGVLAALLMPVLGHVRRAARSATCLANLQQWSHAYQMYLSANHGRSFVVADMPFRADSGNNPLMWWEVLKAYHPEAEQTLLCPEATEPANMDPSDAFHAWGPQRFWDSPTVIRGPYVSSYGFNSWLYHPQSEDKRLPQHLRLPAKEAARVPVMFDCTRLDVPPLDTDPPALFGVAPAGGATPGAMRFVAIERHKGGINAAFLDGHAEHVAVPELWKLKWNEQFTPRDVTVQR